MLPEDTITVQVDSNDLPKARRLLLGKGNLLIQGEQLTISPAQKRLLDHAGIKYDVIGSP